MSRNEISFLEYLGIEEQNILTSMIRFRDEFDLFYKLDRVYQEPIKRLEVGNDESAVIALLYLLVHSHMYFSVSCLMRSHLSECFASMRKAIDATLTAYKIILEPDSAMKYLERDKMFQNIKRNMQNEINKTPSKYPLAKTLIEIHGACSQYGSHADPKSFLYTIEKREIPGTNKHELLHSYFQFPSSAEKYKYYYIATLQAFLYMFMIFKLFLDKRLRILDPKWESTIKTLERKLDILKSKYDSKINQNS